MSVASADGGAVPGDKPAVELRGVTVRYGEVVADRDVSLVAAPGEVHAVVGENGAGKSTLMRALFGLVPAAAGEIRVGGRRIERPSPSAMMALGVGMVHQHFMLVPPLTAAENVVLGDEPITRAHLLDEARAEREVAELSARFALAVSPRAVSGELSVGEQQRVEILKALRRGARVLILDEPTAVLTPPEVAELMAVLRGLREAGGTVLLVTHKLDEVRTIADRVTVLRRGEVVARFDRREGALSSEAMARAMVGRELAPPPPRGLVTPGEARLEVEGLVARGPTGRRIGGADGLGFQVRGGEILGVAGVEGNGQGELAAALVGALPALRGRVKLDGRDVTGEGIRARRERGLGYVPEDRQRLGLLLGRSVADNLLLGRESLYARWRRATWGPIDRGRLDRDVRALLERLDVRPADPRVPVRALSGGNQQKVVLARELAREPRVLIAAQPTRGVDVGAIERIHGELDAVRRAGGAVLLISAELDELLALADRIAVLYRGRFVATLDRAEATLERLGALMTGAEAERGAAA